MYRPVRPPVRGLHPSEPRRGVSRQHRVEPDDPMRTRPMKALTGRSLIASGVSHPCCHPVDDALSGLWGVCVGLRSQGGTLR